MARRELAFHRWLNMRQPVAPDQHVDRSRIPRSPIGRSHIVRLALYQPDLAPNFGAAIRLAACLGVGLDFIEPCGFPLSDKVLKRVSLDYGALVSPVRHRDFKSFCSAVEDRRGRLVAVETRQAVTLERFSFTPDDVLLLGRETEGLPEAVVAACAATVSIPMAPGARSLNLVTAAAIAVAEGLRQTRWTIALP